MRDRVDQGKTMLTLQVTFSFIYHLAIKKFCDGKTEKNQALRLYLPVRK
jgi:hypothetical protein